jgi:hypothetical protein
MPSGWGGQIGAATDARSNAPVSIRPAASKLSPKVGTSALVAASTSALAIVAATTGSWAKGESAPMIVVPRPSRLLVAARTAASDGER